MFTFTWSQQPVEVVVRDEKGFPKLKEDGSFEKKMKEPVFSGSITLKVPKHTERIRFAKTLTSKVQNGELIEDKEMTNAEKIFNYVREHVQSVCLVRISDGLAFDSIEMLEHDKDGEDVIGELGNKLIEGVRLGKN